MGKGAMLVYRIPWDIHPHSRTAQLVLAISRADFCPQPLVLGAVVIRGSDGAATRRIKEVWTPPMLVTRPVQGGDRYYSCLAASNVSGEGKVAYSGRSGPVPRWRGLPQLRRGWLGEHCGNRAGF